MTGCIHHIGVIVTTLNQAVTDDLAAISDVSWLLIQFSDWLHVALLLCFRADQQVCTEIINC